MTFSFSLHILWNSLEMQTAPDVTRRSLAWTWIYWGAKPLIICAIIVTYTAEHWYNTSYSFYRSSRSSNCHFTQPASLQTHLLKQQIAHWVQILCIANQWGEMIWDGNISCGYCSQWTINSSGNIASLQNWILLTTDS